MRRHGGRARLRQMGVEMFVEQAQFCAREMGIAGLTVEKVTRIEKSLGAALIGQVLVLEREGA